MEEYLLLVISAVFVKNILLAQFLGNCPFLGVSKKMDTAAGMSMAVIFVLVIASTFTWATYQYLLLPFNLGYLKTIAFILVIAALVQFVEMFLKKGMPTLYKSLGVFLPLITTNCAVLGVCMINIDKGYSLVTAIVFSFASAAGFGLALVLFAGIRERFEVAPIPKAFEGTAIGLITAGFLALAFFGFSGMVN